MKHFLVHKSPFQTHFMALLLSLLSLNFAQAQPLQEEAQQAFHQGHYEMALKQWQAALSKAQEPYQRLELLFNIAVTYRYLGMYDQALDSLETALPIAPLHTVFHALLLNELSQLHLSQGEKHLPKAKQTVEQALTIARKINNPQSLAIVLQQWGNVQSIEEEYEGAIETYTEALAIVNRLLLQTSSISAPGELKNLIPFTIGPTNELYGKLLISQAQTTFFPDLEKAYEYEDQKAAFRASMTLLEQAWAASQNWTNVFHETFGLLALGQLAHEIQLQVETPWAQLTNLAYQALNRARLLAERIQNDQAKTFAYGYLGRLYEQSKRYDEALTLTRHALFAAQRNLDEVPLYHWWKQLGRLHQIQGQIPEAITALQQAVEILNQPFTRDKIVTMGYLTKNFRERVAPVYFSLADLQLQQATTTSNASQRDQFRRDARDTIEFFKKAELQDYFQSECITEQAHCTFLEQALDTQTAILYPIVFPDRLEMLVSLPQNEQLTQITIPVSEKTLRRDVAFFLSPLRRHPSSYLRSEEQEEEADKILCEPNQWRGLPSPEIHEHAQSFLEPAQNLYRWLIQPVQEILSQHHIKTLILVPEGVLRTMPFAALHDGKHFLIENYALAMTPGLCLGNLQPWERNIDDMLVSGLSEAVQGFSSLPCAQYEIETLKKRHDLQDAQRAPLFNETFTYPNMQQKVQHQDYSIVHIASHGQFKADLADTFLLTYDDKLSMNRLERIIRGSTLQEKQVELLTLSACQTAVGNDRAALGLAGVALKAGVKSALASLWKVDDAATPAMLLEFYKLLKNSAISKAQALQIAQQMMLTEEKYAQFHHPYYWSAFLLIGNWL